MAAQPTQSFPFLGSDNQTYTGWTIPLDANGNLTVSATTLPLPVGASTAANQATGNTALAAIQTAVTSATPAGTNVIGKVGIDQTTPGTTNKVSIGTDGTVVVTALPATVATVAAQNTGNTALAAIQTAVTSATPAGTNVIGKVGIDQTTPGTTNKVSIGTDGTVSISNLGTSGLATSAKQPALGTAGTASADVLSVQGIASGVPLRVDASTTLQNTTIVDSAGSVKATIKPASTGASASDTALVVAISPNSVNANGQATMATSAPVVISSDQSPIAVKGAGAVPKASSLSVTYASDQGSIPVTFSNTSIVVAGDVASGSTDSGFPVKMGGVAQIGTYATPVTAGSRVNAAFDKVGKQVVTGALRLSKGYKFTTFSATTETAVTVPVTGIFCDLYALWVVNTGSTDTTVTVRDGTGGNIVFQDVIKAGYPKVGFILPVDSAIPQSAVNTSWTLTSSVSTTLGVTALTVNNV